MLPRPQLLIRRRIFRVSLVLLLLAMPPGLIKLTAAGNTDWAAQAETDAKEDRRVVVFDGKTPNKLACDTTLRELSDGSWVLIMLGGGDKEPLPANRVFISRSEDRGTTWIAMEPVDLGIKSKDPNRAIVPSELSIRGDKAILCFSTHDGKFADWKTWFATSEDGGRTFGEHIPAPEPLNDRAFIRNQLITKDGRILLPFQHYVDAPSARNPRNGVMMSKDGGETWTVHGWIRSSDNDKYASWAEPNIAELEDGTISLLVRTQHKVLYRADSKDGGYTWPEMAEPTDIPNPSAKITLYPLPGGAIALLHNPNPSKRNPLSLWISFDGMKTWPYRRVLADNPGNLNYPDGFVSKDGKYLHFAYDDNRFRAVYYGAKLPPLQ